MKIEIKIPKISENVESGSIARVLVSEGDHIDRDQPVVEVETDKASTDIPSTDEGTVKEIKVKEGDEVKVGQVIMILESEEEEKKGGEEEDRTGGEEEDKTGGKEEEEEEEEEKKGGEKEEEERKKEGEPEAKGAVEAADSEEGKELSEIPAAPSVRRMAREQGIDLRKISGSGPGDRITAGDIKKYEEGDQAEGKGVLREKIALPDFSQWGSVSREKLNKVKRITAERTQQAWQQIPHVTQHDEAVIDKLERFRQQHRSENRNGKSNLTITALLIKVVAFALQRFPHFNSSLDAENMELILKGYYNISVAVDTERGLVVPVIRDVDRKPLSQIGEELASLAERTRNKEITPDELQGGNFTVSNLGGIGGTAFTPVIFPPQVAILGVSRGEYKLVYRKGRFRKSLVMPLSLSYDHRVIDGAEGIRFLRWICQALENPFNILT